VQRWFARVFRKQEPAPRGDEAAAE
jgi:hypothetical protein